MRLHRTLPRAAAIAAALVATIAPLAARNVGAQELAGRDRWADSARRLVDGAVARGDRAQITAARALLDRALAAFPDDPLLLHYQGYALWREAGLLLGAENVDGAKPLLEAADEVLERSAAKLPLPETYALRSSVLGQRIGTSANPLSGMVLGPRASSQMERAEELGARNPRVWVVKGMSAMYTPKLWGGGLDKAEAALRQALVLFEQDRPRAPLPAWGRADAYIYLGQVLARQERRDDARAAFQQALALQPDNPWITKVLLPSLDRAGR
jgi:tetratricopeptide (TPR) repeat protein